MINHQGLWRRRLRDACTGCFGGLGHAPVPVTRQRAICWLPSDGYPTAHGAL